MKKTLGKILTASLMAALSIGGFNQTFAANYVQEHVTNHSAVTTTSINGGTIIDGNSYEGYNAEVDGSITGTSGGYNRFGSSSSPSLNENGVRVTTASGNQFWAMRRAGYYKAVQTKAYATDNTAAEEGGTTGTSYKNGGVSLAYTETSQAGTRMGFNGAGAEGGNIYGKATLSIDFKMEKGKYYLGGYSTSFDKKISLYNSNTPTESSNEIAYFRICHGNYWNGTDNDNKYMITYGCAFAGAPSAQNTMVNMGTWYTLQFDVDVKKGQVTYNLKRQDGSLIESYTENFKKASDFVAPVISVADLARYGFDFSFDNIKVTRETFDISEVSIDKNALSAVAKIGNDVFVTNTTVSTPFVSAPKLVLAAYDKATGKIKDIDISVPSEINAKTTVGAPEYVEVNAKLDSNKVSADDDIRAFIWSDMNTLVPYTATILP